MNACKRLGVALSLVALIATGCSSASEPTVEPTAIEPTTAVSDPDCPTEPLSADLWPGLEDVVPAGADNIRQQTSGLTTPYLCQAIEIVDPVVDPSEVGAVAAASLIYDNPYVRIDLFAFEERSERSGALEAVEAALARELPEGSLTDVAGGPYLWYISSWIDDGTGITPDTYSQLNDGPNDTFDAIWEYQRRFFPID